MGFLAKLAKRFVAGETIADIIEPVKALNQENIAVSLDVLGEDVDNTGASQAFAQAYLDLLDTIKEEKLNSNVSLKLTMMGLDLEQDFCVQQVDDILAKAKQTNNFVRIDMEGSSHTAKTLAVYEQLFRKYGQVVGIVIQAYLHRSKQDIERLAEMGASVRVCKGAYKESRRIAYQNMDEIRANYKDLVKILWNKQCKAAIATHDQELIDWALSYIKEHKVDKRLYEFQVLYGLRRVTIAELASEGHPVRVYVPFGKQWLPYFVRRLKERKENVWFVLKGLFES